MFFTIIFSRAHYPNFVIFRLYYFSNSKYLAIAVSIYLIKVANQMFYLSALYMLRNVLLVKLTKLYTINFLFQLCTCSRMCLLLNWTIVHCELYVFSFSFVHAPVCANCNYSCNLLYSRKKTKKKKQKKKTRTSVWVKIPKLCHKNPAIYLFSWEREGILTSPNLT